MSERVEGIRGEYRKPTPYEIGLLVRILREQRGIKRAALAGDAHISEKTLERVEDGIAVRQDSYRRVAEALGLKREAFTRDRYIPTAAEAAQRAKREQEELKRTHNSISVERLTDPRQLLRLFQTHALIADDSGVDSRDLDAIATFKENLRDWSDVAAEIPETARLDAARQLLDDAKAIERGGYEVKVGITDRYGMHGSRIEVTVVAFFSLRSTASGTPSEVWLPKKMSMDF